MEIVMDKDRLEIGRFKETDSLPNIIRNIATCTPFLGLEGGSLAAECLVAKRGLCFDIVNFYADTAEKGAVLISHVVEHCRQAGGSCVEMGCGNANVEYYAMLQRMGFRVSGVVADYYIEGGGISGVQNAIVNRDMIRFHMDLHEKTLSTVG